MRMSNLIITRLCFQRKRFLEEYKPPVRTVFIYMSQVLVPPPEVVQRARDRSVTESDYISPQLLGTWTYSV